MFGKLKNGTSSIVSKDINESVKTLSYLARAEKYFDIELEKTGQSSTKPMLRIIDIIEPLRQIVDAAQKLEKGQPITEAHHAAFSQANEIVEVANDILALNPKGLVASDKTALSKLGQKIADAKLMAGQEPAGPSFTGEAAAPAPKKRGRPAKKKAEAVAEPELPNIDESPRFQAPNFDSFETAAEPETAAAEEIHTATAEAETAIEEFFSTTTTAPLDQPLEWDNNGFRKIEEENTTETATDNTGENVVSLKSAKKEPLKEFGLPQKYFATSYAGMNLQEAAEIINELAENPANLEITLLEHASRVKPLATAKEISSDLLALAPIADSLENGNELIDKKHLSVLKESDRIITACKDLANLQVEGFDRRKQKLFEKFVPQDVRKIIELAKVAYPEVFSSADVNGYVVSDSLLDFADIILEFAEKTDDKLYAELTSQIVSQIALYGERNDLRLKFDVNVKKNRLNTANGATKPFKTRNEVAILRALTFVPKIARLAHDLLAEDLTDEQAEIVSRALEILQLTYVHARDNYSAELQNFYNNKAA